MPIQALELQLRLKQFTVFHVHKFPAAWLQTYSSMPQSKPKLIKADRSCVLQSMSLSPQVGQGRVHATPHELRLGRFLADLVQLGSWKAHPLNKALLAQPASQASLLSATQRILNAAAKSSTSQQAQQAEQLLQQLLLPFVSFALLQPDPQGELLCCKLPDCCFGLT